MQKYKISATIITYNEQNNIIRALLSLDWVDEILVVDSFSNDKTVEYCQLLGAKVIKQKFLGHVGQKQFAVDHASYDWIISLDADEVVSSDLKQGIIELFKQPEINCFAYTCNRRNFHGQKWIKHGGWYPDRKVRLFNRKFAAWGGINPHDMVITKEKPQHLKGDLWHYTFQNLTQNVDTNNKFSLISAQNMAAKKKPFHIYNLILNPIATFLNRYIYKQGFKDGLIGFIIAVGAGYSVFIKYAKLWEIYQQQKSSNL